jgi:hypothetical protein
MGFVPRFGMTSNKVTCFGDPEVLKFVGLEFEDGAVEE